MTGVQTCALPIYTEAEPVADYVGLDEAIAGGLTVTEVDDAGAVETLLVANPLGTASSIRSVTSTAWSARASNSRSPALSP